MVWPLAKTQAPKIAIQLRTAWLSFWIERVSKSSARLFDVFAVAIARCCIA